MCHEQVNFKRAFPNCDFHLQENRKGGGGVKTHTLRRFSSRASKAANARSARSHNSNFSSDTTPGPRRSSRRDSPAINQHLELRSPTWSHCLLRALPLCRPPPSPFILCVKAQVLEGAASFLCKAETLAVYLWIADSCSPAMSVSPGALHPAILPCGLPAP